MDEYRTFDYCPRCAFPTFNHEQVTMVDGEYLHRHCYDRSVMVASREELQKLPTRTI